MRTSGEIVARIRLGERERDFRSDVRVVDGEHDLVADRLHEAAAAARDVLVGTRLEALYELRPLGAGQLLRDLREAHEIGEAAPVQVSE